MIKSRLHVDGYLAGFGGPPVGHADDQIEKEGMDEGQGFAM